MLTQVVCRFYEKEVSQEISNTKSQFLISVDPAASAPLFM